MLMLYCHNILLFVKGYFSYPVLLIASVIYLKEEDTRRLVKYFIWWVVLMLPLNLLYVSGTILPPNLTVVPVEDWAQGTLGTSQSMAYLTIIAFFLSLSLYFLRTMFSKILILIYLSALSIQFFITHTGHAYLFFAVSCVIYIVFNREHILFRGKIVVK